MVGTTLEERYHVLRLLGEGAMGQVFLVEHLHLRRKEALKILHARLASTPQFVLRFRREARATNRLGHPNIVCVYDFGQLSDGRFYLTSEYVDGVRLDKLLAQNGPLEPARVLRILSQLAEAIDHAHERSVVHRDLKPDNLILTEHRGHQDILKILDYGIAKIIAPEYKESLQLTRHGEVSGTPQYMSPEQLRGDGSDPRMDIYAAGVVAFELLVGQVPFNGTTMEIVYKHLGMAPPVPSRMRPDAGITPEIDALVARCLEKDPRRRYASGRELAAAIECVPGYQSHRPGSGRRSRLLSSGSMAAVNANGEPVPRAVGPEGFRDGSGPATLAEPTTPRPPERLTREDAQRAWWAAVHRGAETLVDSGFADVQLVLSLGTLRALFYDLERAENEIAANEKRTFDLEQAARERESSLRFALGELRFARIEALQTLGADAPAALEAARRSPEIREIDRQAAELEQRIGEVAQDLEVDLTLATDKGISLAAKRATIEERIEPQVAAISELVVSGLDAHAEDQMVRPVRIELQASVEQLALAR